MNLYDIAIARKLSGGGGGGGVTVESLSVTDNGTYTAPTGKAYSPVTVNVSGGGGGDFSTATLTIISNTPIGTFDMPFCIEAGELAPEAPAMLATVGDLEQGQQTYNVALYKGMAVAEFKGVTITSVIGDAMWEEEETTVYVMGNCTITVTA